MLFNSLQFYIFFPIVVLGYFLLPHRARWIWLLAASCYFYIAFVPVYILILCFTILVDFVSGIIIEKSQGRRRKVFLTLSIVANIGALAFFKYFNFLNESLASIASQLHWNYPIGALSILLPIGLSFHTFQSMAYTIEVYRGHQKAERHLGILALYVLFFPQLVAGPIERPQHMLPQFRERHSFDYNQATDGLRLMLWGFFMKMVIADRLAYLVNPVFNHPTDYPGPMLLLATIAFAFQIYCDFAGYTNIAIGSARVMGFRLMMNFDRPYCAQSIVEFWRRWHISLSTWFRDYVFIPLGGSRVSAGRRDFNLMVTFLLSGFWHGANWTFIVWGALHGIYEVVWLRTGQVREKLAHATRLDRSPRLQKAIAILVTFSLVDFAWIFFRANTLADALYIVTHLFSGYHSTNLTMLSEQIFATLGNNLQLKILLPSLTGLAVGLIVLIEILLLELIQWQQHRSGSSVEQLLADRPGWLRWGIYYGMIFNILLLGVFEQSAFIYFQF
jgi:D-alanyl-lipoteichoic acid acyltransferase DltB (MBOAT superfamily)